MQNKKHCVPTYIYSRSLYKNVEFFRKKIKKTAKLEKKNNAEYSNGMYNTPLTDTQLLLDVLNSAAAWAYGKTLVPLTVQNLAKQRAGIQSGNTDTGTSTGRNTDTVKGAITGGDTTCAGTDTAQDAYNSARGGVSIQDIALKIASCSRCVLAQTRTKTVPGFGCLKPLVMVIGEGPGADEDRSGLPFVGPAGKLLDKMLEAINLSRHTNCFIGNIVKCRPPHNRDPAPEETQACASFLHTQIHILKPKMILAVGRIAAQNLLATSDGIGRLHGRFFSYKGIPLMPTYHPSALLRDASLKKPTWEDLKLFRERLAEMDASYAQSVRQVQNTTRGETNG